MPDLTVDQLTAALAVVAALAAAALLLSLALWSRLRSARREYLTIRGNGGETDILSGVAGVVQRIDGLEARVDSAVAAQREESAGRRHALQRFHLVRYDAFDDVGGRLSFSAALLDDHGDGLVFTSINGRSESRTYAKDIVNLSSEHSLSDEEREAIAGAFASRAQIRRRPSSVAR